MELSAATDKPVLGLQRAQVEQVMALSKVLGLKVGNQFLANVQKVTQANPEERAELIKVIEANLAQLNKNSAAPAVKILINQLQEQKTLAQTTTLKLVSLTVTLPITNNTNAATTTTAPLPINLLTYTTQPVQAGQTLLMQVNAGQQLQLLQPLTQKDIATLTALAQQTTTNTKATAAPAKLEIGVGLPNTSNINILKQQLLNPPITQNNGSTQPAPTTQKTINTVSINAIGETLRRLLPQKDKGQDLLTQLPKVTQFIQQLAIPERKEWLSNQVQQSLKTLANHIRLSEQLNNPKLVEMTLKNNGQSFEHKLAQLLSLTKSNGTLPNEAKTLTLTEKQPTEPTSTITATATNKSLIGKPLPNSNLINSQSNIIQSNSQPKMTVEKMAAQDLKGALLGLLSDLNTELEETKPKTLNSALSGDTQKNHTISALPLLLGMLMNKQQGELSQKQLRTQLVMLLHQYTLGSLAKIQLQQVHTLNHQLSQTDQVQPTQSWQFEIPVRQGQEVHPLSIHLEQQWVDEPQEDGSEKNNSTRVRQWNIMLSFNLPLIGPFYAQLTLLNNALSAKFWSENERALSAAKQQTDDLTQQLENQGIKVTSMQCLQGAPPKPKMLLHYSLVDIKT